jgi:hypothetical protein
MEEDGDEREIRKVELKEHMAEIWGKIGGGSLERWVAKIKRDMDDGEDEEKERWGETEDEEGCAWDDVNGGEISLSDLRKARKEEIDFMTKRKIWSETSVAECWEKTGKAPVTVRWVDVNKGSSEKPAVRCRLVARDL